MDQCCAPILETPVRPDEADTLATRFRALGDPARLRLLSLIASCGEVCACELVESVGVSQPTVSHHLKVLYEAGLVDRERRGKWIHYWVVPGAVSALADTLQVPASAEPPPASRLPPPASRLPPPARESRIKIREVSVLRATGDGRSS